MLTLASMIWAAYAYVAASMHMEHKVVPMPVTVPGQYYDYNIYEDAIYVPYPWTDNCTDQAMVVYEMAKHFNNFLNGNNKIKQDKLNAIRDNWVCLK